jgi:hypothetical protein
MRRGIERDGTEVIDMTDLVHALCTSVLAGHDVPAQINSDGVWAVHSAFLTEGFDGPAALDRRIEFPEGAIPCNKKIVCLDGISATIRPKLGKVKVGIVCKTTITSVQASGIK